MSTPKIRKALHAKLDTLNKPHELDMLSSWFEQHDRLEREKLRDCFVIMPFSKTKKGRGEKYWTNFFTNTLKPALKICGFRALRSVANGDNIVHGIIDDLVCKDVVLAVLTDGNPNVWYELGVRHSLRCGTVLMCQKRQKLPFDLQHQGVVFYDKKPDVSQLAKDLKSHLKRARTESPDSPVSNFASPGIAHCVSRALGGRRTAKETIQEGYDQAYSDDKIIQCLTALEKGWRSKRDGLQLTIVKDHKNPRTGKTTKIPVHRSHPNHQDPSKGWKDWVLRREIKKGTKVTGAISQSLYDHMIAMGNGLRLVSIEGFPGRVSAIAFTTFADWLVIVESHVQQGIIERV